jgi:hypothetical protein
MQQDLDKLLEKLRELTRAAKEPGRLTREQLDAEVEKITAAVQKALNMLATQVPVQGSAESGVPAAAIQAQILAVLQQSGMTLEKTKEMVQLAEELQRLKRGFIPS